MFNLLEHPVRPAGQSADLPGVLAGQQQRIDQQFRRTLSAAGEDRHTAFGELAWLIAVHETIEEEVVHPITRHLEPAEHLAEHLLDEERRISEALDDIVRVDAAAGLGEVDGLVVLHQMLTTHIRRELHEEFPRLRLAVAAGELQDLGDVIRVAQARATVESPVRPGVPQASLQVRDVLRPTWQQVSA
ncbi:hemerythrin domain-containing protein [Dactylosporangium sp. NPDC049525]|uniref:hemerythrin domain-containing protein n=1 Tax=Dactylosporangium sp. NPDC049525 TaxID=3154730 RepID=UPI00343DA79C